MKVLILILVVVLTSSQIITTNFGCKNMSTDGVTCIECSNRFYKDGSGICQPVSTSCNNYDKATGACTSCYEGFLLIEVICIKDPKPKDPNCANVTNGICQKCSKGFYLLNGKCQLIDPLCKNFDMTLIECTQCYSGYNLAANKTCLVAPPSTTMVGCAQIKNNTCVKCARDYWQDVNKGCNKVDPICKSFDIANGNCLTCYDGFKVQGITCVVQNGTADPNCKKWKDGVCQECSKGFYFDPNNVCIQIDPFCKSFNLTDKICTQCYSGFQIVNNACVFDIQKPAFDINCKTFDTNGVCLNCSKGFYFDSNGVCIQVSPSCKTFDFQQLVCGQCYAGYSLKNSVCVRDNATVVALSNCAEELQGVCVKCVSRAYYDINNKCVMADDLCKTFNDFNGHCTTCYVGYALDETTGKCLPSSTANANCIKTDPNTNLCLNCTKGNYLDVQSVCQPIQAFCQIFNHQSKVCDTCFKGYRLDSNFNCILAPVITAPAVQNCVSYDSTGVICVKCFNRYFYESSTNTCKEADPLCKTFDSTNGDCKTCYTGFTLQANKCVFG